MIISAQHRNRILGPSVPVVGPVEKQEQPDLMPIAADLLNISVADERLGRLLDEAVARKMDERSAKKERMVMKHTFKRDDQGRIISAETIVERGE
jgi:uncharacterized membrane-anchored protein YjiN (DUF445 family)